MAPSAPTARRKRLHAGSVSVHAILLLLAAGVHFQCHDKPPLAEALIAPSHNGRRNHWTYRHHSASSGHINKGQCRVLSTSLASTQIADEARPTAKKKSTAQPKRRKQRPAKKGNRRNKARIIRKSSSKAPSEPWDADYATSVRTQRKIQSAASSLRGTADSVTAAHAVLQTLLDAPPNECNAANVVCALTLSSKTLGRRNGNRSIPDALQQSLLQTLGVLQLLVNDNKLSPRQLCNAAWGISKHVEYNPSLFSGKRDNFVLVNDGSQSSTWDLRSQQMMKSDGSGSTESGSDQLIDGVLNSIAQRVIDNLEETRRSPKANGEKRVQPGELSMLLWAYAAAKPRDCPPGWERPRRVERLSSEGQGADDTLEYGIDFVTFVEDEGSLALGSFSDDVDSVTESPEPPRSVTSRLFDAAAIAFCQGEGSAVSSDGKSTLLKNCTWSELSNIAWSYAARGAYGTKESEAMMTFFAREATRRIRNCAGPSNARDCKILPRDAIQIAWALGTMESDNVSVGDALVHLVDAIGEYWIVGSSQEERPLAKWTCADLVQMATALGHGRLDNQMVLLAIYQESLRRLQDGKGRGSFSTTEISILMWVQARLYLTPKFSDVYGAFPGTASRLLLRRMQGNSDHNGHHQLLSAEIMRQKGLGPQEQANLAWSLTVLEDYNPSVVALLRNIFHAASSHPDDRVVQLEHAHQLWQSYFILRDDCHEAVDDVPASFSSFLERKWNVEKSRGKRSSSRHRAISQTLDLMRVAHRNEYDEDVDVAIVLEEDSAWTHMAQDDFDVDGEDDARRRKVAVEFDGPHHFTVAASTAEDLALIESGGKVKPRVLGHTVLKYRLLKKKGWTVVRIPYYEFDKIPVWSSMERQRYLQRALKTHDKIEFSGVDVSEYKAMPSTRHSRFD